MLSRSGCGAHRLRLLSDRSVYHRVDWLGGGDGDPVGVEGHVVLDVGDGGEGVVVVPGDSGQVGSVVRR